MPTALHQIAQLQKSVKPDKLGIDADGFSLLFFDMRFDSYFHF
jgi:hypothetical protein